MKKTKVENISSMKLDFFLKQNKEDIRVVLLPGESSWCDHGTSTKSMILYERKNLIKNYDDVKIVTAPSSDDITDIEYLQKNLFKSLEISEDILDKTEKLTPVEKAAQETEEYKKESEKKYKGKKRGRKKKRGPKPGNKKNKGSSENPAA